MASLLSHTKSLIDASVSRSNFIHFLYSEVLMCSYDFNCILLDMEMTLYLESEKPRDES